MFKAIPILNKIKMTQTGPSSGGDLEKALNIAFSRSHCSCQTSHHHSPTRLSKNELDLQEEKHKHECWVAKRSIELQVLDRTYM